MAELITFIDFAEGFTLGFIEINFPPDGEVLIETLKTHPDCQEIQFEVLDFSEQENLRFLRDEIVKILPAIKRDSGKKLVLIVRGLAKSIGVFGEYPPILQDLNFVRDAYKTSVPHPLLFVLPDGAITRLAKFAPDFWAWKSGVFLFATPETTREEARIQTLDCDNPVGSSSQPESQERIDLLERLLMEYQPSGRPCPPESRSTCATILQQLGAAYLSRSQAAKAQEYLQEALKLAQRLNNSSLTAEVYQYLGRVYSRRRQFSKAISSHETALKQFEEMKNPGSVAESLFDLGNVYLQLGDVQQANLYYQQCLEIKQELGLSYGKVYHQLGNVAYFKGQFEEAVQYYQKALKILEDAGDFNVAYQYHQLGIIAQRQGRFEEAVQYYQKALKIREDAGDFYNAASAYHHLGIVAYLREQFEEAVRYYQKALEIFEDAGDFYSAAGDYHLLGMIAQEQGQFEDAVWHYQKALKIFEDAGDFYKAAGQYSQLGMVAEKQKQFQEAVRYYQKALKVKENAGDFYSAAFDYHQLGNVAFEQRQFEDAVRYYQTSLKIFKDAGDFYKAGYPTRGLEKILQELGEHQFKALWKEVTGEEISEELYSEIVRVNGD